MIAPLDSPWMHPREIAAIRSYLKPEDSLLEFGSGGSTAYFAPLVQNLVSIEHNALWAQKVTLPSNAIVYVVEPDYAITHPDRASPGEYDSYTQFPLSLHEVFDAVLIDGRNRVQCALACAEILAPGGWLFFHDFFRRQRYVERLEELSMLYLLAESIDDTPQTLAVFRRRID